MQAIGEALDRVRAAEKPVLAYATAYTDDGMLLAAHASEVWVNPAGRRVINGPGGERLYYAGLLDKLKVNARASTRSASTRARSNPIAATTCPTPRAKMRARSTRRCGKNIGPI